jgi:hypothetical protein
MTTYLIDMEGRVVRSWQSDYPLAGSVYLLENGHLLRTGMAGGGPGGPRGRGGPPGRGGGPGGFLGGGGAGGRVQEFTWDGELVWDFEFASDTYLLHHDIERLPGGNVLMIAWERKTAEEAIAAGRNPQLQGQRDLQPDFIIEVKPTGKTTGQIVWQWHMWDHLVQDYDPSRANFADVASHPELINVNYTEGWADQLSKKEVDKLRSLGYLGGPPQRGPGPGAPDWTHTNSVSYNAELDQIVLSVCGFNEIWVIDHSTTTAEAAGHTGGRSGKGGDLLYRWGNPRAYRAGTVADQRLFAQHDASWIPRGLPGEGHILVFNNGRGRPGGNYSSIDEIVPPVDKEGRYVHRSGTAYGPKEPVWSYASPDKREFYDMHISGAQRLPNGNTLVCSGERGTIFEVTPRKGIVWKYTSPVGGGPGPGGPGFGPPGGGPGGFGPPDYGLGMFGLPPGGPDVGSRWAGWDDEGPPGDTKPRGNPPPDNRGRRPPSADRRGGAAGDRQGRGNPSPAGPGFQPWSVPGGFAPAGGPGFGPRRGGPGGFGPGGGQLFRAYRYGPDYPGLVGKDLTPGKTIEQLQSAEAGEQSAQGR